MNKSEQALFDELEGSRDDVRTKNASLYGENTRLKEDNKRLSIELIAANHTAAVRGEELYRALGWIDNAQGFPPGGDPKTATNSYEY